MYDLLRSKNQGLKEASAAFGQTLVRTPSPSLKEQAVADCVQAEMERLGYDPVIRDGAGNVVGFLMGSHSHPAVLLASHMDTMSPDCSRWGRAPYSGAIQDGRLYGAGASDCKGGLAAQIYAGALLKRSLLPLDGTVIVAATVAEENGRSVGLRTLLEQTLPEWEVTPTYAILGEPTDMGLYYGHDGWAEFELNVTGQEEFAVQDAMQAVVGDLQAMAPNQRSDKPEEVDVDTPSFHNEDGFATSAVRFTCRLHDTEKAEDVLHRLRRETRMVTPSAGALHVNLRLSEGKQTLYTGREMRVQNVVQAWRTDPFHELVDRSRQVLDAAECAARPGTWQLSHLHMGTAGSVLSNDYGIPTIGYGPGEEGQAHQPDENVSVANLHTAVYGTAALAHGLVGIPVFGWTSDEI